VVAAWLAGLLVGIGESRRDRVEALVAIRELHARYGHIQEVIIQNFRWLPGGLSPRPPSTACSA
jgi:FO synthase